MVLHCKNTAENMINGLKYIKNKIGEKYFDKYFNILLTDRGSEFIKADEFEKISNKVFYCDAMASYQKAHVENAHKILRYILPKEKDLKQLGLHSQEDLDLIASHINSYTVESLFGRNPIETFEFFHPEEIDFVEKIGLSKIEPNNVILNSKLIKK
jgi:IS30 family transposase